MDGGNLAMDCRQKESCSLGSEAFSHRWGRRKVCCLETVKPQVTKCVLEQPKRIAVAAFWLRQLPNPVRTLRTWCFRCLFRLVSNVFRLHGLIKATRPQTTTDSHMQLRTHTKCRCFVFSFVLVPLISFPLGFSLTLLSDFPLAARIKTDENLA